MAAQRVQHLARRCVRGADPIMGAADFIECAIFPGGMQV